MPSHLFIPPPAPCCSPSNFHITILNSTAVEASWFLPTYLYGLNGRLIGFKIFVDKFNGSVRIIDIPDSTLQAYIITGLEPATLYTLSILMYNTVADGPEGIRLRVMMPDSGV